MYRMTGAGTWEQLNDLNFESNGNSGSITIEAESSGPSPDTLEGKLSSMFRECIKEPVKGGKEVRSLCPMDANSFFLKLPAVGKKIRAGTTYPSRNYQVREMEIDGRRKLEARVDERIIDRISSDKWEATALFHKFLFRALRYNAAASGEASMGDLNDEVAVGIKDKQGVQAAAKFVHKEFDHTEQRRDKLHKEFSELREFFVPGRHYLDLVFGTSCQWRVSIIHSAGIIRGFQFEREGVTFLLLMNDTLESRKEVRKRASAVSIQDRQRKDSKESQSSAGSGSNSVSSTRSRGSSLNELPESDSHPGSPEQPSDDDQINQGLCSLMLFNLHMRPFPSWYFILGAVGPLSILKQNH